MPRCPYCAGILQPQRYCATCRLTVTPHQEHYDGNHVPRTSVLHRTSARVEQQRDSQQGHGQRCHDYAKRPSAEQRQRAMEASLRTRREAAERRRQERQREGES